MSSQLAWQEIFAMPGARPGDAESKRLDFGDPNDKIDLFTPRSEEINRLAVKASLDALQNAEREELPDIDDYAVSGFVDEMRKSIGDTGVELGSVIISTPTAKVKETAIPVDLSLNVAPLSRAEADKGRQPPTTGLIIREALLDCPTVEGVEQIGPFINIQISSERLARGVIGDVVRLGGDYGRSRRGDPKRIIVDFSSPNTAKNMTVAHLRSTIIGESLRRIHQATGNAVIGINHIGDWGTQFGGIILQYQAEMAADPAAFTAEVEQNPGAALMRIYREYNRRVKDEPEIAEEASRIFTSLESGDKNLQELWGKFREWSLQDFGPIYERLGIQFDVIQGESFYENFMGPVVQKAIEAGVLIQKQDGSIVFPSQALQDPITKVINEKIMLDQDGNPRDELIVKPGGGTLYLTRDLAAVVYRTEVLGADEILYVIGKEQRDHCLKLFAMADQIGCVAIGGAKHIGFGHINFQRRKMSSRGGKVVLLNDLLDEVVAAAQQGIIARKSKNGGNHILTDEDRQLAEILGVSSVIFNDLKQERGKDIEFRPDSAANLEQGGSLYIQYTNARINSILDTAEIKEGDLELPEELEPTEREILLQMSRFPNVVRDSAETNMPHKVAIYLGDLCRMVNDFYQNCPVLRADTEVQKDFRLRLLSATQQVIKNAAYLVQISLPERM